MLDYELLDFGDGRKLERFGTIVVDRPEILAHAPKTLEKIWADKARFSESPGLSGSWTATPRIPDSWVCALDMPSGKLDFILKPGRFKHVGLFPEQEKHWRFLARELKKGDRFLNLFAYTGASSLVASQVGADVFHVDSSRSVINWAAKNAETNGISNIHWVCDDALKFAERECKRGNKYAGIIMDPPVFGKGAKGENRRLADVLRDLINMGQQLLLPSGFLIVNTYSPIVTLDEMSEICIKNGLQGNEKGWLSVHTSDKRALALSKYVIARKKI